jgi:hypothetical protein
VTRANRSVSAKHQRGRRVRAASPSASGADEGDYPSDCEGKQDMPEAVQQDRKPLLRF